jgi:hypothetical protein
MDHGGGLDKLRVIDSDDTGSIIHITYSTIKTLNHTNQHSPSMFERNSFRAKCNT